MARKTRTGNGGVPPEREAFARNFKRARLESGLSQREIYRRTGLAYTYLSRLERCRENISLDTMATLAETVGKPLHELLKP